MSAQPAVVSNSPTAAAPVSDQMFVSTSLDVWTTAKPEQFTRDVQINDTVYRQLDAEYYAWLRTRMALAKEAAAAGRIAAEAFEELRLRFNVVHEWAIERFGQAHLLTAVRRFQAAGYAPPVAEGDRPRARQAGTQGSKDAVSPEAVVIVDVIAGQAIELGWTRERLYGSSEGRGRLRPGLVRLLRPGERIGAVTQQWIEIIGPPPNEVRQRFYNPDVEQPWVTRLVAQG